MFLKEAMAALAAGMSPGDLSCRLKAQLLESSERLDYHLDGDQPMVLYRLWLRFVRGRALRVVGPSSKRTCASAHACATWYEVLHTEFVL